MKINAKTSSFHRKEIYYKYIINITPTRSTLYKTFQVIHSSSRYRGDLEVVCYIKLGTIYIKPNVIYQVLWKMDNNREYLYIKINEVTQIPIKVEFSYCTTFIISEFIYIFF